MEYKKKGYLKIHIAVNINTKEILALEVTDEKVQYGKVMPKLIEHILNKNNNVIKIDSALGMDGSSYDSNENFKFLQTNKIKPGIKVKGILSSHTKAIR